MARHIRCWRSGGSGPPASRVGELNGLRAMRRGVGCLKLDGKANGPETIASILLFEFLGAVDVGIREV